MVRPVSQDAAHLAAARDRIATSALAYANEVHEQLGALILRPHQTAAVRRLLEIMACYRGALLADAVGLGKTYVALAIAKEYARPLVICPAGLRSMWTRAMTAANVSFSVMSIESLARGERPTFEPDVIIVDEAHHLRTPTTRRYVAVAHLARHARLLLLSATPLQNRRRDLTAVLALFVGAAVNGWTDTELARLIVRRDEDSAEQTLPRVVGPEILCPGNDDDCLDAICSLPPAIPAADEGAAAALAAISLVHLWASSRAALVASLRKRRARAIALTEAIASGHLPTGAELSAWHYADESLQLAFPFCVGASGDQINVLQIRCRLEGYIAAVTRLIVDCRSTAGPDEARAALIRTIRSTHPGERVVAFSQYAQTVTALGRLLRAEPGVAIITANAARIASGGVLRQEILNQFAGDATHVAVAERVELLLSTDLLSEGVDLRGASVVIHLDLPWNPARLEQRVGRARRLGSRYDAIHVYTFVPPAAAERMLTLQRRLAAKLRIADALVGGAAQPDLLPVPDRPLSPVAAAESLRTSLRAWLDPIARRETSGPIVAAAAAPVAGWLAVVHLAGLPRLLHSDGGQVTEDPSAFLAIARQMGGPLPVDDAAASSALARLERWIASQSVRADTGIEGGYPSAKRAVLNRLAHAVARTPRHRRPAVVAVAQRARACVSNAVGIGAELLLDELAKSVADDEAWIHSVEAFGALHATPSATGQAAGRIGALILLSHSSTALLLVDAT
jgi:helicase-like protein/SNF2 domain-containing protein